MSLMRLRLLPATCAAAAVVSACTGGSGESKPAAATSPPTRPSASNAHPAGGVISGRLVAIGGPTVALRPLPGRVEAVGAGGDTATRPVTSDGRFRLKVAPGTYTLTGRSPLSGNVLCRAQQPATVSAGEAVTADIYCHEK